MAQPKVLVWKLAAINALATAPISEGKIAALCHEARNDAMKRTVLKVKRLSRWTHSSLTGAKCAEVLRRTGDSIAEKSKDDSALILAVDGHIKEDLMRDLI